MNGASYDCTHLDPAEKAKVEKTWQKYNPLGTICKPKCPQNRVLDCHGFEPKTRCAVGSKSYKPKFENNYNCQCIGKCGHPKVKNFPHKQRSFKFVFQATLSVGNKVIVPCSDTDKYCQVTCPIWEGVPWELRYGTQNFKTWDGWLECKCDKEGKW